MGWNVDFFSIKVLVLLFILLVFLIIALVIVVLEYKIRQRQKRKFTEKIENIRLVKLRKALRKAKTPQQKLAVIDKHAKSLFRERHHISTNHSYSELVKILESKQAYEYSGFCKKMFEAYYSDENLTEEKVKELLKILTRLIRETEVFLDPEKYNVDKLIAGEVEEDNKKTFVSHHSKKIYKIEEKEKLIKQKEQSIKTQKDLVEEKAKIIKEQEKELAKKEHKNQKLLKELDNKIDLLEKKIQTHMKLQKQIEEKLTLEKQKKEELKQTEKKSEELKKTLEFKETQENWRDKIKVNPIVGKEWLKQHKNTRRTKNR